MIKRSTRFNSVDCLREKKKHVNTIEDILKNDSVLFFLHFAFNFPLFFAFSVHSERNRKIWINLFTNKWLRSTLIEVNISALVIILWPDDKKMITRNNTCFFSFTQHYYCSSKRRNFLNYDCSQSMKMQMTRAEKIISSHITQLIKSIKMKELFIWYFRIYIEICLFFFINGFTFTY